MSKTIVNIVNVNFFFDALLNMLFCLSEKEREKIHKSLEPADKNRFAINGNSSTFSDTWGPFKSM